MDKRRCFRCQGPGHIALECPNKSFVFFVEYQAAFEELEEEEQGGDKELYLNDYLEEAKDDPDEGELLVIRRV